MQSTKIRIILEILRLSKIKYSPGRYYSSLKCVNINYRGTAKNSPARRLLVDFTTGSGRVHWLEHPDLDPRYLRDVAKAYMRKTMVQQTVKDFAMFP
jgi:hypothetical protein